MEFVGYRALAATVIRQAWSDFFNAEPRGQVSARLFFLASDSMLPLWAAIVGIDPDVIRDAFRRRVQRRGRTRAR